MFMKSEMFSSGFCVLLLSVLLVCHPSQGNLSAEEFPGHPGGVQVLPSSCRNALNGSSSPGPEIRLPFVDLVLHNQMPIFVLREPEADLLLLLHGPEIHQLHVATGKRRLVPLGGLAGRVRQRPAFGAEIVAWRQFLLLALVLEDSLEVYQLPREQLLSEDPATQVNFEPLQEFSLSGGFQQLHLLKASAEQVLLLVASNYTRIQSKCRTFEWLDTYFNPLEEFTLPAIRVLQVVGRQPVYLIFGRSLRGSQSRLVLTLYELDRTSLRLQHRQALTVQATTVHAFRFRSRNRLIACTASASDSCLFFRMIDGQFVVNRKHARRDLHFRRMTATKGGQLLVGARANGEVLVFGSARLDCYSGFAMTGEPYPRGLLSHRNAQNESFLVLAYRLASGSVLRTVQLGAEEYVESANQVGASQDEDLTVVQLHRHEFEESINGLRGLLLRRRSSLAALRIGIHSLQEQEAGFKLKEDLHLLEGGHIGRLELEGEHLRTPSQLKQRLEELRRRYEGSKTRRMTRSFGAGNDNDTQETLKGKRVRVGNLIYGGVLVPGYILDTSSSSTPLLTIRGAPLLTKTLHAKQLMIPPGYPNSTSDSQTTPPEAEEHPAHNECVVRRLQVEQINGVTWNDFLDSLFLRSRDTHLEGRLVLQSRTKVDALQTILLNGLVVDQLFNLRGAQVISSNIFMSAFFAPRLEAQSVNGLDFARDIVFRGTGNNTWVKTPVRIDQMSVSGDLQVANRTKRQLDPEKEQRLQQYYTGRITIRGSLTVRGVQRDTVSSRVMLGNQSLARSDLQAQFLLNQEPQLISNLTFGYARVSTPSLNTSFLGGHPAQDHLLSGGQPNSRQANSNQTLHIIFMNASVQGDVLCRDYSSRLAELSREAVRQGQETNITGHKRFLGPVTVQDLQSQQINGLPVSELVLRSHPVQSFQGTKRFARLVVGDELRVEQHLNVSRLNGLPLEQLLGHDLSLERLELTETPHLKMLHFRRLNGLPFDDLLSKISEGDNTSLLLRKQLLIEGSVRFEKPLRLRTINGLEWDEYLERLVRPDANAELSGRKSFLAGLQLSDALHTPHVNNLDLSSLLDNTLLRMTPQEVSGAYSFGRLVATHVDVPRVNGVPREEFIDTRKDVQLQGDLYLQQLTIGGGLKCPSSGFGLQNLEERVELVKQLPWRNLIVTGDALWDEEPGKVEEHSQLEYLRQHAVRREGNQTITGHVLLRAPHLKSLQSKQSLPSELNLSDVAEDALLRWTRSNESQVVKANHELLGSVRAGNVHLARDAHFGQVNGIDIKRLNASLYRLSSGEAIAAHLHFLQAPEIGSLQLERPEVNGAPLGDIFQQDSGQAWPRVRFRQLQVQQSLDLGSVNEMSLEYFLQHRIPLKGAALEVFGSLSFEQLQLGKPLLRTINEIPLDNVVLQHSRQVQTISGAKTFHGGVQFQGPGHVMNLNGRDLSESYRGSIFRDKDYNIDSLVLDRALFAGGLVQPEAVPPAPSSRAMEGEKEVNPLEELQHLLTVGNQSSSLHRRLLYLDHDSEPLAAEWVKPSLRGNADYQVTLPLGQTGPCQRRELRAQLRLSERRVLLVNATASTSSSQLSRISSGDVKVKIHNHCHRPARRLRSRISFSCRNESHTLGMRQPVEAMHLLDEGQGVALLLLGTEEEVRVLLLNRTNCSLKDWQSVTPADGRLMKVIRWKGKEVGGEEGAQGEKGAEGAGGAEEEAFEEDLLLTSGLHGHRPVLAIHAWHPLEQSLKLLQLIPGSYDLAELQEDQLLLTCPGCRHIAIFGRPQGRGLLPFEPRQQLSFERRVQQLVPFRVGEEQYLLVVTQPESEHFYLFKYGQVEGWQQRSFGHKKPEQWAFPLVKSGQRLEAGETPLLLLCDGGRECSLVRAVLG